MLDWLFYTHCFVLAENGVMHDKQLEKIGLYRFDGYNMLSMKAYN